MNILGHGISGYKIILVINIILVLTYAIMVSQTTYPGKNVSLSDQQQKLYGYTNGVGATFGIALTVIDVLYLTPSFQMVGSGILHIEEVILETTKLIGIIVLLYLVWEYSPNTNTGYAKFKLSILPLVPFLCGMAGSAGITLVKNLDVHHSINKDILNKLGLNNN